MKETPFRACWGLPNRGERWGQEVRKEEAANPYRTHTSLLPSTSSPHSPISYRPPSARVCVRAPGNDGNEARYNESHASPLPSGADAPVCVLTATGESRGIPGPDPQTNEMQGHGISFCEHCGAELKPQITRRGHPKRYCSDACRARAWRRRNGSRRDRDSFEGSQEASLGIAGKHHAGNKTPDSVMGGEEASLWCLDRRSSAKSGRDAARGSRTWFE